jgi:hypothetical protein
MVVVPGGGGVKKRDAIEIRKFGKTAKAVCRNVNEIWWHNYKMTVD